MTTILYIWQGDFPWDIRVEKMCLALKKAGARVVILARWSKGAKFDEYKGIEIIRVGFQQPSYKTLPISGNPVWKKAIQSAIDDIKPDLIMPREIMLAETAARLGHKNGIPVIMDMAEHYPAALRGWKKYNDNIILRFLVQTVKIPDWMEKRSVALCDGIITVCQEQNDRLRRSYSVSPGKLQVITNTPAFEWFCGQQIAPNIPPKVIAYHGHITPERGLEPMIEGFSLAAKKFKDLTLEIAGDGEAMADIQQIVERSPFRNRISLLGKFSHEQVSDLYNRTDIGVIPHRVDDLCNHTLPNKLFDYMACGKPVLVSLAAPMKRIVEETRCGIAVDCSSPEEIAEGISQLFSSDLQQMSENGLKAAQSEYNWDIDSQRLISFLKNYISF